MKVASFNINFLGHFLINFLNLCTHHQEETQKGLKIDAFFKINKWANLNDPNFPTIYPHIVCIIYANSQICFKNINSIALKSLLSCR